jgi:hypothetical protein
VITKFKSVTLPTGEELTYYRSDGGTVTIDVQLQKDGPIVASSTSGSMETALLGLAQRFEQLEHEVRKLAGGPT